MLAKVISKERISIFRHVFVCSMQMTVLKRVKTGSSEFFFQNGGRYKIFCCFIFVQTRICPQCVLQCHSNFGDVFYMLSTL